MKITVSSAVFAAIASSMLVACGGGGGGSQPPPPPPPTDTTAPVTALDNAPPALTIMTTITFSFSANEPSTFETRVDGAAFATAPNPQVFTNLGDGSHTFEVRARDAAGNLDSTPRVLHLGDRHHATQHDRHRRSVCHRRRQCGHVHRHEL